MLTPEPELSPIRQPGYSPESRAGETHLVIIRTYTFQEMEISIRQKTFSNGAIPGFFPYRTSQIDLVEVSPRELRPCALYALLGQLETITDLRDAFSKLGIDPLQLGSETTLIDYFLGSSAKRTIGPPIIEISEDDGNIPIIVDGLHRVIIARQAGLEKIKVIMIRNTSIPLPVLPVNWEEIDFCRETPVYEKKRRFRFSSMEENLLWLIQNKERFKTGFESEEKFFLFWKHFFYRSLF